MVDELVENEAPDCRGCGRRMRVEGHNHGSTGRPGETAKWVSLAACECCPLTWSPERGWQYVARDENCKHVEFEHLEESCPECGAPHLWQFTGLRSCPACGWEESRNGQE